VAGWVREMAGSEERNESMRRGGEFPESESSECCVESFECARAPEARTSRSVRSRPNGETGWWPEECQRTHSVLPKDPSRMPDCRAVLPDPLRGFVRSARQGPLRLLSTLPFLRALLLFVLVGCGSSGSPGPGGAQGPIPDPDPDPDPVEAVLVSLIVRPANATVDVPGSTSVTLAVGQEIAFVATATFSDGSTRDWTEESEWRVSRVGAVEISNVPGARGRARATAAGVVDISARDRPSGQISPVVSVRVVAASLLSIAVTPALPQPLPGGRELAFRATGLFSDGVTSDLTESVEWRTSDRDVASISNVASSRGLASGLRIGATSISARDVASGVASKSVVLEVTAAALDGIEISSASTGPLAIRRERSFRATGSFSDETTLDLTRVVTWSSSNPAVLTISNEPGEAGQATALAPGTSIVRAVDLASGRSAPSIEVRVSGAALEAIVLDPSIPVRLPLGLSQRIRATGSFSDGSTQDLTSTVSWSTSAIAVAVVDIDTALGIVAARAVGLGTARIVARDPATTLASSAVSIQAITAVLEAIEISPSPAPDLPVGRERLLRATGHFSDRSARDISDRVTWSSSAPDIASVSNAVDSRGLASGLAVGSAQITALDVSSGVSSNQLTLRVSSAVLESLEIAPQSVTSLPVGRRVSLVAIGTFSDRRSEDLTRRVTWSSSNGTVAAVSNGDGDRGLVMGVSPGLVTIEAVDPVSAIRVAANVSVSAAELESLAVEPAAPGDIPVGRTVSLRATGTFSDRSTQDLTDMVTWSSSVPAVVQVSNAVGQKGIATALARGDAVILARDSESGVSAPSVSIRVTAARLDEIAIEPSNPAALPAGRSLAIKAVGKFSDGSVADVTTTVTFASSAPGVATVSNAEGDRGVVTGIAPGETALSAADAATSVVSPEVRLVVSAAVLDRLVISPATPPALPIGRGQAFRATGHFSDGSTRELTTEVQWTSSSVTVARVSNQTDSAGVVTGLAPGSSSIGATDRASGMSATPVRIDVSGAVLDSLSIEPSTTDPLPVGRQIDLRAVGTFSDGSKQDLTSAITWSSGDAAIVSVSNASGSAGRVTGLAEGSASVGAVDTSTGTAAADVEIRVIQAILDRIDVEPASPSALPIGRTLAFSATGSFSDGSTRDVSQSVTWTSSDAAIASVSNSEGARGVVLGVASGVVEIRAREPSTDIASPSVSIVVSGAVLESLAIVPAAPPDLPVGRSLRLAATGTFSDGSSRDLTESVTWSTSDGAVADVSNVASERGRVSGLSPGTATLRARDSEGVVRSQDVVLRVTSAVLEALIVSPSVPPALPVGRRQSFGAIGNFSDGSTQDLTETVTWKSSVSEFASISNQDGSSGVATARAQGITEITATDAGSAVSSLPVRLEVTNAALETLSIEPVLSEPLPLGRSTRLDAIGTFSDGTRSTLTEGIEWSSSDGTVIAVSNAEGTRGRVTALAVGLARILAIDKSSQVSAQEVTIEASAAILERIAISPGTVDSLPVGRSVPLRASGEFSDRSTRDLTAELSWRSSDPDIASVSSTGDTRGLLTGVAAGTTTIDAVDAEASITAPSITVRVTAAVLESIAIEPSDPPPLPVGTTIEFQAIGAFSDGSRRDLTTTSTWRSSNETVASIANATGVQGLAVGIAIGQVEIVAIDVRTGTRSAPVPLVVSTAILESIAVTPSQPAQLPAGRTQSFRATGTFSDNSARDLTGSVIWSTSNSELATISNSAGSQGLATGVSIGVVEIRARDGASDIGSEPVLLTVSDAILESLAVSPVRPPSLPVGRDQAFRATGGFSDGSFRDLTDSVTWSSNDTGVATISNSDPLRGVATGLALGVTAITATDARGRVTSLPIGLIVTSAVLDSIRVDPNGIAALPEGRSRSLRALGTFTDGSVKDLTESFSWSTSDPGIAEISNASGTQGRVRAVSAGTTEAVARDVATGIVSPPVPIEVSPAVLESLSISPDPAGPLALGLTLQLSSIGLFSDGSQSDLTTTVTWRSSAAVIEVSNADGSRGIATAANVGNASVTATDPSTGVVSPSISIDVTNAILRSIDILPNGPIEIPVGGNVALEARATFSDGSTSDVTSVVVWESSDSAVISISNAIDSAGHATGLSAGASIVTARDVGTSVRSGGVDVHCFAEDLLRFGATQLIAGARSASIPVLLDHLQIARGFSFGVRLDPAVLSVVRVDRSGSVAETADFFLANLDRPNALIGVGCIFDTGNDPARDLLPTRGHILSSILVDVIAPADSRTELRFEEVRANPKAPPTKNVYTAVSGASISPRLENSSLVVEAP
jgi:hypothetical protein